MRGRPGEHRIRRPHRRGRRRRLPDRPRPRPRLRLLRASTRPASGRLPPTLPRREHAVGRPAPPFLRGGGGARPGRLVDESRGAVGVRAGGCRATPAARHRLQREGGGPEHGALLQPRLPGPRRLPHLAPDRYGADRGSGPALLVGLLCRLGRQSDRPRSARDTILEIARLAFGCGSAPSLREGNLYRIARLAFGCGSAPSLREGHLHRIARLAFGCGSPYITGPMIQGANSSSPTPLSSLFDRFPDATATISSKL